MSSTLFWYLIVSGILTAGVFIWLLWDDLMVRYFHPDRIDHKFGYSLQKGGVGWWFTGAMLPFVNLVIFTLLAYVWIRDGVFEKD